MKSSKIMFLLILVVVGAVSVVNAEWPKSFMPYLTESGRDEEGRTIHHIFAENCDKDAKDALIGTTLLSDLAGVILADKRKDFVEPSVLLVDNRGRTARSIAENKFEETGNENCKRIIQLCLEKERQELRGKLDALKN